MNEQTEYFLNLWETRGFAHRSDSTAVKWNDCAGNWLGDLDGGKGKTNMRERVGFTASFLRSRNLLGENESVVDVGCGPGLFVTEFAKTAKFAVGFDISAKFIDYAVRQNTDNGNATFRRCDFLALDIAEAGFERAFDLVFASITPAASGKGSLAKLIQMSRSHCCIASFVNVRDSLAERVSRDVFGQEFQPRWDGTGFYALNNYLWLSGYYPETAYFDDVRLEQIYPTTEAAAVIAQDCGSEADTSKVLTYLEILGKTERHSEFRYGITLWDVNRRDKRVEI
ncbi:MAG: class I SAM-dependent methyltransferase [Oscillospiraceae bacterium]|jgi:SAM-dependent methyltransferase|nr:class I SAM-dependent methyltransferase [Oscillospiraceae bacterium]